MTFLPKEPRVMTGSTQAQPAACALWAPTGCKAVSAQDTLTDYMLPTELLWPGSHVRERCSAAATKLLGAMPNSDIGPSWQQPTCINVTAAKECKEIVHVQIQQGGIYAWPCGSADRSSATVQAAGPPSCETC